VVDKVKYPLVKFLQPNKRMQKRMQSLEPDDLKDTQDLSIMAQTRANRTYLTHSVPFEVRVQKAKPTMVLPAETPPPPVKVPFKPPMLLSPEASVQSMGSKSKEAVSSTGALSLTPSFTSEGGMSAGPGVGAGKVVQILSLDAMSADSTDSDEDREIAAEEEIAAEVAAVAAAEAAAATAEAAAFNHYLKEETVTLHCELDFDRCGSFETSGPFSVVPSMTMINLPTRNEIGYRQRKRRHDLTAKLRKEAFIKSFLS
jgi:hypothetical protein